MGKIKEKNEKREFLMTLKSKERYRWYKSIKKLVKTGYTVRDACKEVRIGRSEYYYWDRRIREIKQCSKAGASIRPQMFRDISRKPHISPTQTPPLIEDLIVKIRKKTNTGAEYIQFLLRTKHQINMSVSGVQKVLKRKNLILPRKYHRRKKTIFVRREYKPGEKIQVDTKYVKISTGKTYYQFSAIDIATGIIFKKLYEHIDTSSACDFLRLIPGYYPFPIKRIQTDNGFEYTWRLNPDIKKTHPFTTQCQLLGYEHILIPPASPTYNSHVERTHRIDKQELWNKKRYLSLNSMKKDLKKYVFFFNFKRPTKSKNWKPPVQFANDAFGLNINKLYYPVLDVCN